MLSQGIPIKQLSPAQRWGLLIYNTADAGVYPANVYANRYYYWNGTQWVDIGLTTVLKNYLANRVYSLNSKSTQEFTYTTINNTSNTNGGIPVTFADTDMVVSTGNIVTKAAEVFTINITGLYEISAYVNYNPNRTTMNAGQRGAFLNLKLQRSLDNGKTWSDVIGNRTAWGIKVTNYLKTVLMVSTPVSLTAGNKIRLVVQNPFPVTDQTAVHGEETGTPLPAITTSAKYLFQKV